MDVEPLTCGLSPDSLAEYLSQFGEVRNDGLCWNRQTNKVIKACLPMHTFGHPARCEEILSICEAYNITLIEDATESLGSFSRGLHTGRVGKAGIFSFNGNKIVTTGGGGAIITDNMELANKARKLTTTAKVPHSWSFDHDEIGFNYRMPNLNAALGVAQLEQLPDFVEKKRQLADIYLQWCKEHGLTFVVETPDSRSNYWLNALLLSGRDERDNFLEYTNKNGIMTRPVWTLMTDLPMYSHHIALDLFCAKDLQSRIVNIPSSVIP